MLISLSNRFVFIANMKTASTAIERALRPYSELALVEADFDKHQSFGYIAERFEWMVGLIDPTELFVFGVMRDPVDYVVSLYNSHSDPKFKEDPSIYTGGMDFDQFLNEWAVRNEDQFIPQYLRFIDKNGCLAANYIISYEKLAQGLRFVGERIGVNDIVHLTRENESHGCLDRDSLTAAQRSWIEARFAKDRDIMNNYCDRLLTIRPRVAARIPLVAHKKSNVEAGAALQADAKPSEAASMMTNPVVSEDFLLRQTIEALYRTLLLREPDKAGLNTYFVEIANGLPLENAIRRILRSREFAEKQADFRQTYLPAAHPQSLSS